MRDYVYLLWTRHQVHGKGSGQQAATIASAQDWAKANIQGRNTVTGNVAGDTVADRMKQSGASNRTQRSLRLVWSRQE